MSQQPIQTIRVGGTKATIWANDRGDGRTLHTTSIVRSYMTEGGEWKETNTFLPNQLPELILASQKAFEFIHLGTRSQDREHSNEERSPSRDESAPQEQSVGANDLDPFAPEQSPGGFTEKVTQQRAPRRAR
ncbi:hypothetical protein KBB96_04955 [Luteolibacter ambystomatis]|uniref:Uncharacterized protein n=1 Tax=Luteolibacter ambystomatis TaxID=2824561 RepID=A0A975PGG9_9BACT|nr:hypothetical protein [Luteolibacter ambystomatis]QUE52241.1 hypothetical protein KBB96_04955 [Luteolibacter ambystomatis]